MFFMFWLAAASEGSAVGMAVSVGIAESVDRADVTAFAVAMSASRLEVSTIVKVEWSVCYGQRSKGVEVSYSILCGYHSVHLVAGTLWRQLQKRGQTRRRVSRRADPQDYIRIVHAGRSLCPNVRSVPEMRHMGRRKAGFGPHGIHEWGEAHFPGTSRYQGRA